MNDSVLQEIKDFFLKGSALSRLIGFNVLVFVVVGFIRMLFFLMNAAAAYDGLLVWLGVPSSLESLIIKPWTLITYMFMHFDFFHILFNMIMLFIGGRIFKDFLGDNRLAGTYLLGGLAGAIFFIAFYNIFPVFAEAKYNAIAVGASASVLAIFVAIATYMPNYQLPLLIIGKIRLKYIAIFFVVLDLISIDKGNSGGHLAHLGGALWGYLYIQMLKSGNDPAASVNLWLKALMSLFKPKSKLKVEYTAQRPVSDDEYNKERVAKQKEVDRILDKISKHGYDSLSSREKELLFRNSKT